MIKCGAHSRSPPIIYIYILSLCLHLYAICTNIITEQLRLHDQEPLYDGLTGIKITYLLQPTIISGGVCPQISPSPATGEYLIHVNYDYQQNPLRINSSDLSQFRDDFNNNRFQ